MNYPTLERALNSRGYTITTYYEGMTCYHVEKDGKEIYHGFSVDEIIERLLPDLQ